VYSSLCLIFNVNRLNRYPNALNMRFPYAQMQWMTLALIFAQISCGNGNGNENQAESVTETSFRIPNMFERMVDFNVNNLLAEITINSDDPVTYYGNKQDDIREWTISVNVNLDVRNTISISWFEIYDGTQLLLSEQEDNFFANSQKPSETISVTHTSSGDDRFDFDNDLISNLEERKRGSNPLSADPPNVVRPNCSQSDCISANALWRDNTTISRRQGANSTYAMAIQRIVYCLSHADVTADTTLTQFSDGIYGPNTEAAVENYQEANGLVVDGIVGRQTWSELRTELQGPNEFDTEYDVYYISSNNNECNSVIQFFQTKAPPMGWEMAAPGDAMTRIPMTVHREDLP